MHQQKAELRVEQLGPELVLIWDAGVTDGGLICCITIPDIHAHFPTNYVSPIMCQMLCARFSRIDLTEQILDTERLGIKIASSVTMGKVLHFSVFLLYVEDNYNNTSSIWLGRLR